MNSALIQTERHNKRKWKREKENGISWSILHGHGCYNQFASFPILRIVRLKERSWERGKTDGNKRESYGIIEKDKKIKRMDMQGRMKSKGNRNKNLV